MLSSLNFEQFCLFCDIVVEISSQYIEAANAIKIIKVLKNLLLVAYARATEPEIF